MNSSRASVSGWSGTANGSRVMITLLSASPGEILAPLRDEEAFVVCRLINKTEPTLRDDEVIGRLDSRLLQTHFSELTRGRVRWAKGWEQIA